MGRSEPWTAGRRVAHLGSCGRGVLVLMPALGSRPPSDRGKGQGGGAAGAWASELMVAEREKGAKGEGAAGVAFSTNARDEGGAGIRTRDFVRTSGR
jgi:hypothetical protein